MQAINQDKDLFIVQTKNKVSEMFNFSFLAAGNEIILRLNSSYLCYAFLFPSSQSSKKSTQKCRISCLLLFFTEFRKFSARDIVASKTLLNLEGECIMKILVC